MKKLSVLVAILAIAFASCKKEYTCNCYLIGDLDKTSPTERTGKGKDATDACKDAAVKLLGIPTETCEEKK